MVGQRHDQHAVAVVRLAAVEGVLHECLSGRRVPPLDVRLVHAAVVAVEGNVKNADHVTLVGDDGALVVFVGHAPDTCSVHTKSVKDTKRPSTHNT